jgi:hypothetical protein
MLIAWWEKRRTERAKVREWPDGVGVQREAA